EPERRPATLKVEGRTSLAQAFGRRPPRRSLPPTGSERTVLQVLDTHPLPSPLTDLTLPKGFLSSCDLQSMELTRATEIPVAAEQPWIFFFLDGRIF
ncbi:mCG1030638, partial [Mus musculus]